MSNSTTVKKYDDVLLPFLALMRNELYANAGKGDRPGWLKMDRKTAILEVHHHLAKLQKAVLNDDAAGITEFAADVANMAMMVVDVCGALSVAPAAEAPNPSAALQESPDTPNEAASDDARDAARWRHLLETCWSEDIGVHKFYMGTVQAPDNEQGFAGASTADMMCRAIDAQIAAMAQKGAAT